VDKRVFNALSITLTLLLGLNLASSLRSYAKLLRWRMLSTCYRPLREFDYIMKCDSLSNVIHLLLEARGRGKAWWQPSKTQTYAGLWPLTNLLATLIVNLFGLVYNFEVSRAMVLTNGQIEVSDLTTVLTDNYQASLSAIQSWGIKGYGFDGQRGIWANIQDAEEYESLFNGTTLYYLTDWNHYSDAKGVSLRYVRADASCRAHEVQENRNGTLNYVVYTDGEQQTKQSLQTPPGPGGLAFITNTNSTCGPRCTSISAFLAQSLPTSNSKVSAITPRFFTCTNTVSNTHLSRTVHTFGRALADEKYHFPDLQARMLAGAIGWSGTTFPGTTSQHQTYPRTSIVNFETMPTEEEMADFISSFTTKAIAAGDSMDPFWAWKVVDAEKVPVTTPALVVSWRYAAALLGFIPLLHFCTLMIVVIWANKAVIKDDSGLAGGKVYYSLLKRLEGRGCMLTADEIVEQMPDLRVAYGFVPGTGPGDPGRIDVFEEGEGVILERAFREGWYDG
jgi:hypothetical protein